MLNMEAAGSLKCVWPEPSYKLISEKIVVWLKNASLEVLFTCV
jgi:hypothetical protein